MRLLCGFGSKAPDSICSLFCRDRRPREPPNLTSCGSGNPYPRRSVFLRRIILRNNITFSFLRYFLACQESNQRRHKGGEFRSSPPPDPTLSNGRGRSSLGTLLGLRKICCFIRITLFIFPPFAEDLLFYETILEFVGGSRGRRPIR